jgi:putative transposase
MDVVDARRLYEVDCDNGKLKKLLAEALLDIESLKVIAWGKR